MPETLQSLACTRIASGHANALVTVSIHFA